MTRLVLMILFLSSAIACNCQSLSYTDFMYFTKINDGDFLMNYMSAQHYEFTSGYVAEEEDYDRSGASSDDEDVTLLSAVWCSNCTYEIDSNHFEYYRVPFSYLTLELKRDWIGFHKTVINYLFPDKIEFDTFIRDAKNYGFTQKDSNDASTICRLSRSIVYDEPPINNSGLVPLIGNESIRFYIENGYYKLCYTR